MQREYRDNFSFTPQVTRCSIAALKATPRTLSRAKSSVLFYRAYDGRRLGKFRRTQGRSGSGPSCCRGEEVILDSEDPSTLIPGFTTGILTTSATYRSPYEDTPVDGYCKYDKRSCRYQ
jgi:hypothetical protein